MRDADLYFDDYHDYDDDNGNFPRDEDDHDGRNDLLHSDYGFQKRMEDDVEAFVPKDFFNFQDHGINEKIKKLVISDEVFMIITETNALYRWEVGAERVSLITIPGTSSGEQASGGFSKGLIGLVKNTLISDKKEASVVERVFLDPKGTHCLICTSRGENYYLHQRSDRVRPLRSFQRRIRSAIIDDQSTDDLVKIACGTSDGNSDYRLYFFTIELNKNFEVNDFVPRLVNDNLPSPIIEMEYFHFIQQEGNLSRENIHRAVFALTSSFLYYFSGSKDFHILFEKYIGKPANEYPGLPLSSSSRKGPLINFYMNQGPNRLLLGNSFILCYENLFLYCKFPEKIDRPDFNPFSKMRPLQYAKKELRNEKDAFNIVEPILDIAASQYHYFILHKDCLTILSTINENVVAYYEGLDLCDSGKVSGMVVDKSGENIYIYDSRSVKTISLSREGQDVWKLYLDKEDKKKYEQAYKICKNSGSSSVQYVAGLYADQLFENGEYELAADIYTETSRSFEEVCLKYINKDVIGPLDRYLQHWLRLVEGDKMRRVILLSWLLEYKLHVLNQKEKQIQTSDKSETEKSNEILRVRNQFTDFYTTYRRELDENVAYSLLQSHGRFEEFVDFAEKKERLEDVILHYINEEKYELALEKMTQLQRNEQKQDIMYKHCHILMKEKTEETLHFIHNSTVEFDLPKLIPGFMNVPEENRKYVVDFLWHYCTETTICREKSIHNIYIFLLANLKDEERLDEYLGKQEELLQAEESGGILYDMDFALRNFQKNGLIKAQIKVYGMMGLYSDAISLALDNDMIEEAKNLVPKHDENSTEETVELQKKLWLQIAQHLIQSKQTEAVIKLTKDSENIIRIEDLLPQFDDDFKIELFKDDISASLKTYIENIKKLKNEMAVFDKNGEHLKNELRNLKNRYFEIRGDQKCEQCMRGLFLEEFYVFPCGHCFHKECLKKKMKAIKSYPEKMDEIEVLDQKLTKLLTDLNINQAAANKSTTVAFLENFNPFSLGKKEPQSNSRGGSVANAELEKQIKATRERLDFLLAGECLSCGRYLIETITLSFDSDEKVRREWEI